MSSPLSSSLGETRFHRADGDILKRFNLRWLEEPVMPDDVHGYAALKAMNRIPIAGGEHAFTVYVVHLGGVGSGARMKLVNNFVCGVQAAALAEALAFSEACHLDPRAAMSVLANGAPGSPLVKAVSARMLSRDYTVSFMLSLMRKDLDSAIQAGWGGADFAALAEVIPGRPTRM